MPVTPLVDVPWLAAHPQARIVDLRWSPRGPAAIELFRKGHIPGAVCADLDRDLARPGGPGRHPFPPPEDFAALLGRLGISEDTHVVVYDDSTGSVAARLWFMLRVHGHERASVLDGGLRAWTEAGHALATGDAQVSPVPPRALRLDAARIVDRQAVAARGPGALLLDARAPERYRGEVEPIDRVPGHIPGAVNAPFSANLGPDGRFRPAAELRALYAALGADSAASVIASCGSGVTACHDLLALELAGLPGAKLYTGSWSDWSHDPHAKVATGAKP